MIAEGEVGMRWWLGFAGVMGFLAAVTPASAQTGPGGHDLSKVARHYRVLPDDPRWKTAPIYIVSNYDYQQPWNLHYYLKVKVLHLHPQSAAKMEDYYDSVAIFVMGGDVYADPNQEVRDIKRIDLYECASSPDGSFKQASGWAWDHSIPFNVLAETNIHYKIKPLVLYTNETRAIGTFPCAYLYAGDSYFFPAKGFSIQEITHERARQLAPGTKN
jgi:hypothetical protein